MRVLYLTVCPIGDHRANCVHAQELSMALAARGHHVRVVMKFRGMPPPEDQRELDEHSSTCSPAGSAVVLAVSAR